MANNKTTLKDGQLRTTICKHASDTGACLSINDSSRDQDECIERSETQTRYEVQTYTLCDGWVNSWTVSEGDGAPAPETFSNKEEAQAEIDELLSDVQDEIANGERDPEHGYDASEFRIVAIASQGEAS